ncbi:MAG: sigma-70 family RNA polymerase sigma factor [Clostridium sp.]|uniref:sigma-70 family RNA polymerase sigma factor n=1 Tax=Clostridium TaxID=1485 RepID=UPI0023300CC3|nr:MULTISPECIES: sigma-70 family RNA polymerase sigma factor [Clostridium]MDB2118764.1 sigma-70 family RNA polymerase sigma factor [Clostridium paraputrificum]MDU2756770.1 sigma-70 family RNA polymerase sigma factor [Clostridium sp.]MDU2902102.1 sigma-70 family RNA polymerase sigma factor [Clostridium sp.]MDU4429009.1 sigma-70 family RNA polymerase sigma factor [Clostridium sp.]MDU7460285.1 sigma-70 family RNA polymerase sigma factor [Clostridium sp.]
MDYKYIESLVKLAKEKDTEAQELLVEEFKPIIYGLRKKISASGYEREDLISESYRILFNCIDKYDLSKHRFVAYSINAIKNNFKYILRKSTRRGDHEGLISKDIAGDLESIIAHEEGTYEKKESDIIDDQILKHIFKDLAKDELELINLIVFEDYTVREYAALKKINYSMAVKKKKLALDKIKIPFNEFINNTYNI